MYAFEVYISITNGQRKQGVLASCIVSRLILYYLNGVSINLNSYHKFISVLLFDHSFADIFLILLITNVLLVKLMMHQHNQKHESCSEV